VFTACVWLADPFVVCFRPDPVTKRWKEYGRTETVPNTLNPDFATRIIMDFHFEEVQPLRFAVFDRDSKIDDLSKHDFIGEISSSVGEIVGRWVSVAWLSACLGLYSSVHVPLGPFFPLVAWCLDAVWVLNAFSSWKSRAARLQVTVSWWFARFLWTAALICYTSS
jgi:hypothetical protein